MLGSQVPELRSLELLVAVARTGSLSAAAVELGISQQAASSRLRTTETLVGASLLTRTPRGSELTPTGELVVQWADRVLEAAHELDAGLTALRTDRRGHLTIASSLTIAEHLLPGWLVAVRSQQQQLGQPVTEITMTATNSARVVELVATGRSTSVSSRARTRRRTCGTGWSARTAWCWWSRPAIRGPPSRADGSRAATLASTPLVVREEGSGTRMVLERALEGLPTAAPALELSSTAAVRSAVAAGAGPAVLGAHAVRDDLDTGRLVSVGVTGVDLTRRLHAVWRGGPHPAAGSRSGPGRLGRARGAPQRRVNGS